MKMRLFDNNGRSADRYTVIINNDVYTMSLDANMPNGVNMYCGKIGTDLPINWPDNGVDIGFEIAYQALPSRVLCCVIDKLLAQR